MLAARLAGVAHVVTIEDRITYSLTARFGQAWSVFGGAIRIFRPGATTQGDPRDHRRWLDTGDPAIDPEVLIRVAFLAVTRHYAGVAIYDIESVQREAAQRRTIATDEIAEAPEQPTVPEAGPQLDAMRDELALLRAQLTERDAAMNDLRGETARLANERDDFSALYLEIEKERDQLAGQLASLGEGGELRDIVQLAGTNAVAREVVDGFRRIAGQVLAMYNELDGAVADGKALRDELDSAKRRAAQIYASGETHVATPSAPQRGELPGYNDPDGFERYVTERYAGRVAVSKNAKRAFADGVYRDLARVYDGIDLLGTEYYAMRTRDASDDAPRLAFEERRKTLQFREISKSMSPHLYGQYPGYRFVHDGREYLMDLHLRDNSGGYDPRLLMVIYFTWDEAHERVILGSLPAHLDNSKTT
jgi:hypothetical protein